MNQPILELQGIEKAFPGVKAWIMLALMSIPEKSWR